MATLMAGHRNMEDSKQVRDDPSTTQALKLHQGRAQGADQAPLAAIARVSAAKSETWILVLCLRVYSDPCCQSTWGRGENAPCLAVLCQTVQRPPARMCDRYPPAWLCRMAW